MKKAFRDTFNRELALLYERSAEFAAEYPGIADRLGGLLRDNIDPAVAGLLEGTAFLAARVQLKLEDEFSTFTTELLEQVFPDALAPIPSVMLVAANPPYENKELAKGIYFKPGENLDARFVDADQQVSCSFRLCSPLEIWPLSLTGFTYHDSPAPLVSLGQDVTEGTKAGLQITLQRRGSGSLEEGFSDLELNNLPIYLTGDFPYSVALYEQIHCDLLRISLRYQNANGDAAFIRLDPEQIEQIGFNENERILPRNTLLFDGFAQLREAFIFPRKYLGFRITRLKEILPHITGSEMQIILEFGHANNTLAARVNNGFANLHTATAVNLFEETASQVRLDKKRHEYVVTPSSSPVTHYEIHKIIEVFAHYTESKNKEKVFPLHSLPENNIQPGQALYYSSRRKPRRLTKQEKRFGVRHKYRGTETFISLYEPAQTGSREEAKRLQIKTLCSNRHLPEYLPIAGSKDDFYMSEDGSISLACVAGPTPPREPITEMELEASNKGTRGEAYWRLISYLSLSHFGLDDRNGRDGAASLREILRLFATISDNFSEAQIQGITDLETRPIVRSILRGDSFLPARGIEIKVTFDEEAFEGSGIILLGSVLDRFFAEYASINSFTQTVIISSQRGVIKTWPPRTGNGALI